jgi:AraC-like DNA-binding protein
MPHVMHRARPARLERSCRTSPCDWVRAAPPQGGIERIEAFFAGHGFDPHRHDTYAIGVTLRGVQSFGYRGGTKHSLCGQAVVLHPDEMHDGSAGTDAGFHYRLAYIEPRLVQEALGTRRSTLPFVREAVTSDARLIAAISAALEDLETPLEDLERDQIVVAVAEALAALDRSSPPVATAPACFRAVARAREFLDANVGQAVRSDRLEAITGLSRFALARHFRACLGTSPYRYLIMRRLDRVRSQIRHGVSLAEAAAASGFADQSHMARQFKRAYGVTPGRWQMIAAVRR